MPSVAAASDIASASQAATSAVMQLNLPQQRVEKPIMPFVWEP